MAKVIFEVATFEQAQELAAWYQGEQDAQHWFENNHMDAPLTDKVTQNRKLEEVYVKC